MGNIDTLSQIWTSSNSFIRRNIRIDKIISSYVQKKNPPEISFVLIISLVQ